MGSERWVILCVTCCQIVKPEIAFLERQRAIEHRWIASTATSRSPVGAKLWCSYVLINGGRQASSDGSANTTSRHYDGSRLRGENTAGKRIFP